METAVLNLTHLRIDWNVLGIIAMPVSLLVLALTLALLGSLVALWRDEMTLLFGDEDHVR